MKTMIVLEVVKALKQATKISDDSINNIINMSRTYRTNNEPTRVNADDVKSYMINWVGVKGAAGDWNKLASLVCITMEK